MLLEALRTCSDGLSPALDSLYGQALALVKGLVELWKIEVKSDGAGPAANFLCICRSPHPVPADGSAAPPIASSGRPVLVADDNKDAADSLAMVLELSGHEVRVAHGGRGASALPLPAGGKLHRARFAGKGDAPIAGQ